MTNWKPSPRQEEFLSIPDSVFEALYGGAAGGGKTETLLILPLIKKSTEDRHLFEYPRFKALYLRRTFPELENEVIPRSQVFYKPFGFTYNATQKRWTHTSGSIIQFGHCEYEKDVTKYDTAEYNIILWDEVTSFTPYQYEYISFTRCRSSSPYLPAIVRSGTNPGNVGHTYHFKRFVKPHKEGGVILRETRKLDGKDVTLNRIFIPSKVTDNPYLTTSDPNYINKLNSLPPTERAAKLEGNWEIFSGQVFSEFRISPLFNEPANACHLVDGFPIPYYWPRVLSIDWGYSALVVASWYAINPVPDKTHPGKIYKYREYTNRKKLISEWGADVARLNANENLTDIVMDPSAWSHRGDTFTINEQFEQASGMTPRKADNDRLSGKLLIQEYLRFTPRPKKYTPKEGFDHEKFMELHRKYGPEQADQYYQMFQADPAEEFLPKLLIFKSCPGIVEHLPRCIYKIDTGRKSEDNQEGLAEDVAELKNDTDDYYDELRYGLKACQAYLDLGASTYSKEQSLARIEQNFQRHKDLTQYYIELDNLKSSNPYRGIKRFRGRGVRLPYANF